jgi:pyruvate formate lyase activating enzyme
MNDNKSDVTGMVTDIQRCSIHDGPGIRTTVFLKGCNLRCPWCHNPETISPIQEWMYYPDKCIGCGFCEEGCYAGAKVTCGKRMTVDEVLKEIMLDQPYYAKDGGLTISGGEPLLQRDFTLALLNEVKSRGIHVAIESNMTFPWEYVREIAVVCDLIMMDMKLWREDLHKKWTGKSNIYVRENMIELSRINKPIILRTPIVPGVNDDVEEIENIARFASSLNSVLYYELLPYHPLGQSKQLGEESFKTLDFDKPKQSDMNRFATKAKEYGVEVRIAGKQI